MRLSQTFRYGVVSAFCLIFGVTLISTINSWGIHYSFATVMAFSIVAIVGFVLHCFWTFSVERTLPSFIRYLSALGLNIPLTIILIGIGHDLLGLTVPISTLAASILLFLWNFFAARWALVKSASGETH